MLVFAISQVISVRKKKVKKNDIVKTGEGIFRIISVDEEAVLAIDCEKKMMPKFFSPSFFEKYPQL